MGDVTIEHTDFRLLFRDVEKYRRRLNELSRLFLCSWRLFKVQANYWKLSTQNIIVGKDDIYFNLIKEPRDQVGSLDSLTASSECRSFLLITICRKLLALDWRLQFDISRIYIFSHYLNIVMSTWSTCTFKRLSFTFFFLWGSVAWHPKKRLWRRLTVSPNEAREPVDILLMLPGIMIWMVKSLVVDISEMNIWQILRLLRFVTIVRLPFSLSFDLSLFHKWFWRVLHALL